MNNPIMTPFIVILLSRIIMIRVMIPLILVGIYCPDMNHSFDQQKYHCYYQQHDQYDQKRKKELIMNPDVCLILHLGKYYATLKS